MAKRDHTLDAPILEAAAEEFLANGYEKASLRKIAAKANVTVGAIYTRYDTKDSLFCSLVAPLLGRVDAAFATIRQSYQQAGLSPAGFERAMQQESEAILHLLFDEYDRAVLLLCRSRGSSLEHCFDQVVQRKIDETLAFFQSAQVPHPDEDVLKLLVAQQFHMYFQIINEGYGLAQAKHLMHAAMLYHSGGWAALLGAAADPTKREEST